MIFRTSGDYQYAEITVNGKTGTRTIPLFSCIPYLKELPVVLDVIENVSVALVVFLRKITVDDPVAAVLTRHHKFDIVPADSNVCYITDSPETTKL